MAGTKKYMRGQYKWSPQRLKLLRKLWSIDRFHRVIVLNNLGCTSKELTYALRKFNIKRKRVATKKSKDVSFTYKPKLDIEKAREIRRLVKEGVMRKEIARMFGVSTHSISLVRRNKIWKEKEDA